MVLFVIRSNLIGDLNPAMDGNEVVLTGWVHEVRETGKITFLLLRDSTGIVQVVGKKGLGNDEVVKSMNLPKESVISVKGIVKANKEAKQGFEIVANEVKDINPLSASIPFEVTGKVPVEIDVRLNYRYIDLRRLETAAVFKIQSTILQTFMDSLMARGFIQIRTPSIIAEASEGGSELFPVVYFEKNAYLAQSPQLYKQLAIIGGMGKVTMIMPVFRAEKSNTVYHVTESTQMDIEMAFANAEEVIEILSGTVVEIIKQVIARNKRELDILGIDLKVPDVKTVTYTEAIDALRKKGHKIEHGHDFAREHENDIQKIYGDAVVIKEFPAALRAFYSMPMEGNPEMTHSFDFIYKGLEICSGAQRIHIPELLVKSLEKKGLNPKNFEFYVNAFRCGAPPHAGWSVGLERLTMQIVGAKNIRDCSMFPRDRKRLTP